MPAGKHTDPQLKAEILRKIHDEGVSVYKIHEIYGISTKTVYGWLNKAGINEQRNLILENNRLKKELDTAYRVIGRLTTEVSRPKG